MVNPNQKPVRFLKFAAFLMAVWLPGTSPVSGGQFSFSANYWDADGGLYVLPDDGAGQPVRIFEEIVLGMDLSPDGSTLALAFAYLPARSHLATLKTDGSDERLIVRGRELFDQIPEIFAPRWSPDGSLIAFYWSQRGPPGLYTADPAAPGASPRLLLSRTNRLYDWGPDGAIVWFGVGFQGWVLPPDESESYELSEHQGENPRISPDGQHVCFRGYRDSVFIADINGHETRLLGTFPPWSDYAWDADSRRIFIVNQDGTGNSHFLSVPVDRPDDRTAIQTVTGLSAGGILWGEEMPTSIRATSWGTLKKQHPSVQ